MLRARSIAPRPSLSLPGMTRPRLIHRRRVHAILARFGAPGTASGGAAHHRVFPALSYENRPDYGRVGPNCGDTWVRKEHTKVRVPLASARKSSGSFRTSDPTRPCRTMAKIEAAVTMILHRIVPSPIDPPARRGPRAARRVTTGGATRRDAKTLATTTIHSAVDARATTSVAARATAREADPGRATVAEIGRAGTTVAGGAARARTRRIRRRAATASATATRARGRGGARRRSSTIACYPASTRAASLWAACRR